MSRHYSIPDNSQRPDQVTVQDGCYTDKPLITHTSRSTGKGMGYDELLAATRAFVTV